MLLYLLINASSPSLLTLRVPLVRPVVPSTPNTTAINQWGSFKLQHPRLAFIDGSEDRTPCRFFPSPCFPY